MVNRRGSSRARRQLRGSLGRRHRRLHREGGNGKGHELGSEKVPVDQYYSDAFFELEKGAMRIPQYLNIPAERPYVDPTRVAIVAPRNGVRMGLVILL